MNLEQITIQVIEIVREAGDYIKSERGKVKSQNIDDKSLNNLVSYVDQQAERKLVEGLKKLVPNAGFLTEEETVEQSDTALRWIIDPLDGTTNFLFQLPIYAVSVALANEDDLMIGVVYIPELNEMFYAFKNGGAFLNGKSISVSKTDTLQNSLAATGFPYYKFAYMDRYMKMLEKYMRSTRGVRRLGSAAVDLVYVACGRFDFYFEFELNPYDVAGGLLILHEAGGKSSMFAGKGSALEAKEILASNGVLHEGLVEE